MSTLAKLAAPNLLGMMATTAVSITETVYLGLLGIGALAASALVLPLIMLMGMMSAGAMGGGVSSAISRALGAGDVERRGQADRDALDQFDERFRLAAMQVPICFALLL
jgi:Na+-driven multidrug efflux pump